MRIAIIGGGVSGLVCAHMLHSEHELVVFEACSQIGGHANTVTVATESGVYDIDTGFIVFNERNYPNFERLLNELEVETQASLMSFGVSDGGDFEYNGLTERALREPHSDDQAHRLSDGRGPDPLQPRHP